MVSVTSGRFEQKYIEFMHEVDQSFTEPDAESVRRALNIGSWGVGLLVLAIRHKYFKFIIEHSPCSNDDVDIIPGWSRSRARLHLEGATRAMKLWREVWSEVSKAGYPADNDSLQILLREVRR